MEFLAELFGNLVKLIYNLTGNNYGLSIIIFTILTKLILFPLTIKQIKSTEGINKIKPEYDKIMEKYKNNKEKQAEEISKLYAENKISPFSGCLVSLIQIPLVLSMFYIVRYPLTYVIDLPQEEIKIYAYEMLDIQEGTELSDAQVQAYEIQIAKEYKLIDMNFLGLNLGDTPKDAFSKDESKRVSPITLIIPLVSFLISLYQVKSNKKEQMNSDISEEQAEMQKSMNLMMPILSASISFSMPLALGIYWLLGSILGLIQQEVNKKIINNDKEKTNENHLLLESKKGGSDNE